MSINIVINPLRLDNVEMRSHSPIEIFELNDKIVFLHTVLADMPGVPVTRETVFPNYIVADFFSVDFGEHTQYWLMYPEKKAIFPNCCLCERKMDYFLLNTAYYQPCGGLYQDNGRHNTLFKLIEIREISICEIGESPEPAEKVFSDKKTFVFGDFAVNMASDFILECTIRTTGMLVWKLRLNAWLYTDIEEKDDILYLGTAGHGGRFYGISLQDGKVIFAYDTGGTTQYNWYEETALMTDRKGNIILLDSKTGAETRRIAVKNQRKRLCVLPQMLLKGNQLYAVARTNKFPYYDFYAICVEL